MTLEGWNTFFQYASAVLLGLTFAIGAGAIVTGLVLNKRQAEAIANTGRDAANANERASRLELEAAQQRERAANAEKSLLELQQQLAPRRLTETQRANLLAILKGHTGGNIVIVSAVIDPESADYADELDSAFRDAGWHTRRIRNRITTGFGVQVGCVNGNASQLEQVKWFSDLLTQAGVTNTQTILRADDHSTDPWFEAGIMYLIIEHKPPLVNSK